MGVGIVALSGAVFAQTYPARPIRVIYPSAPGSVPEVLGRLIAESASRRLGQPLVFDIKPGASGLIGMSLAAKAPPDGYTIAFTNTSSMFANFAKKTPVFDPLSDFVPISASIQTPVWLAVRGSLPVSNVRELVAYAKKNPGKLNYASSGLGSFNHLMTEQFKAATGVELEHIPYQGSGRLTLEIQAGRVDVVIIGLGTIMQQWKAGQVKVLAAMQDKRFSGFPDIPAIGEEIPGIQFFDNWFGFVAPRGTPEPIIKALADAFAAAALEPDIRKRIDDVVWVPLGSSPEVYGNMIRRDYRLVEAASRKAGVEQD